MLAADKARLVFDGAGKFRQRYALETATRYTLHKWTVVGKEGAEAFAVMGFGFVSVVSRRRGMIAEGGICADGIHGFGEGERGSLTAREEGVELAVENGGGLRIHRVAAIHHHDVGNSRLLRSAARRFGMAGRDKDEADGIAGERGLEPRDIYKIGRAIVALEEEAAIFRPVPGKVDDVVAFSERGLEIGQTPPGEEAHLKGRVIVGKGVVQFPRDNVHRRHCNRGDGFKLFFAVL